MDLFRELVSIDAFGFIISSYLILVVGVMLMEPKISSKIQTTPRKGRSSSTVNYRVIRSLHVGPGARQAPCRSLQSIADDLNPYKESQGTARDVETPTEKRKRHVGGGIEMGTGSSTRGPTMFSLSRHFSNNLPCTVGG
jgi:hypothetical protein